jgi:signal transduction histidine kinase
MLLVTTVACVAIGCIEIVKKYRAFNDEAVKIRERTLEARKIEIRQHVDDAVEFVEYKRRQTEARTKEIIKERTYEAYNVASHIYERYKNAMDVREIEDLVREALRPIRYNDGQGYFFAAGLNGIEELFPDKPELEGHDLLSMQDTHGKYVIRDMIELVQEQGEGYYSYTWTKPESEGNEHRKLSYVKHFAPFDWLIGTGEYVEDTEAKLKREAIDYIQQLRFGEHGYMFAGQWDGVSLAGPASQLGENMLEITDSNGVKIVRELIDRARNEGGFVSYVMPKFEGERPDPKLSYAKGVDAWQWYVGMGVYVDDIDDAIAKLRSERVGILWIDIAEICAIIGLLWIGVYLLSRRTTRNMRYAFDTFSSFFEQTEMSSAEVLTEGLEYSEWERLAISANRMISQRRQAERAMRLSEERLFETAKLTSLGTLVGGIAHEINNPNNFIRLSVENLSEFWNDIQKLLEQEKSDESDLVLKGIPYDTAKEMIDSLIESILQGSQRIEKLIVHLREYANRGESEADQIVDIKQVVETAITILGDMIKKSTHEFSIDISDDLPEVRGDSRQLVQVLIHILSNSCQALTSTEQSIRIVVSNEPGSKWLTIEVADEGEGIAKDDLPRICDPFFTTKRDEGRTGLGLSVSYRIVEDHDGTLAFRSEVGAGTSVIIRLLRVKYPEDC